MYPISPELTARLKSVFTYHAAQGNQSQRYELLRSEAHKLARIIAKNTPVSAEQTLALRKLEEAIMHANAAIARNESWVGQVMQSPMQLVWADTTQPPSEPESVNETISE